MSPDLEPAFVSVKSAVRLTSLSKPTIYRRIAEGTFPPTTPLGGGRVAFRRDQLDEWIADPALYRAPPIE